MDATIEDMQSSEEETNPIEEKLKNILEETRRKMINYENGEESSQTSSDEIGYSNEPYMLEAQPQYFDRMRNKAMTP
jgi:hypothetical protein